MRFGIVIKHERANIRLQVERVSQTLETEQYKVTARNGTFILKTNRPLLRNKGLKYKPAKWDVVGGQVRQTLLDKIIEAIEIKVTSS